MPMGRTAGNLRKLTSVNLYAHCGSGAPRALLVTSSNGESAGMQGAWRGGGHLTWGDPLARIAPVPRMPLP